MLRVALKIIRPAATRQRRPSTAWIAALALWGSIALASEPGVVTAPTLLAPPEPEYPAEALAQRVDGPVRLRATLDATGTVTQVEVLDGPGHGLNEAAADALRVTPFSPALRDGTPIPVAFDFVHTFVLPRATASRATTDGSGSTDGSDATDDVETASADPAVDEADSEGAVAATDDATSAPPEPARPLPSLGAVVRARANTSTVMRRGSEAVDVVDVAAVHGRTEDLAEVLTRDSAVQVQRTGGMGSRTQLSLAGLSGDQVRVLLDGVPIEYSPFVFGLGNVPVSLVQQLEIFNGVVPVRLATDALGGAIHLRTDLEAPKTGGSLSLQGGSFDAYRGTAQLTWLHDGGHRFVRGVAFHDRAENDYVATVPVDDPVTGRVSPREVHRHHDAYRASGANVEVGLLDLRWADRLVLNGYFGRYDKEIPHNQWMTHPYGEVTTAQESLGATLRWSLAPQPRLKLAALAGVNRRNAELNDTSDCIHDWYGTCRAKKVVGGEIGDLPLENRQRHDAWFARARALVSILGEDDLEASLGVDGHRRTGENAYFKRIEANDPLRVPLGVTSSFGGVSHRQNVFSDRLENVVFVKGYLQHATAGDSTVTA